MASIGDHMVKPFLVALFNHVFQPLMILLINVSTSLRDVFNIFIDMLKGAALQVAVILKAFRFVEINITSPSHLIQKV